MCDCLALVALLGRAASRLGRPSARGLAWGAYALLEKSEDYTRALSIDDMAELLGVDPLTVGKLLSAFTEFGLTDAEGRLAGEWAKSVTKRDNVTVTGDVTPEERKREQARLRKRAQRDREKAAEMQRISALDAVREETPIVPLSESVTVTCDRPLEEDRISLSSPERVGARNETVDRRENLMNSALEVARRSLPDAIYVKFVEQLTDRGRYERYLQHGTGILPVPLRDTCEKLFKMVQKQRQNAIPSRTEPQFPLPISFKRSA